ncbi:MAG TPA: hypothetical protein GX501_01715, partial [Clostridiaceae bacterium]|nr:hypothetical protein [Clostridiaceae bacterium]
CVACSKKLAADMIRMGKTLNDALQRSSDTKDNAGLRYMHGERKETREDKY